MNEVTGVAFMMFLSGVRSTSATRENAVSVPASKPAAMPAAKPAETRKRVCRMLR